MWQLKIVRQLNHTKPGRDTEIMTKKERIQAGARMWLLHAGINKVPEQWYSDRSEATVHSAFTKQFHSSQKKDHLKAQEKVTNLLILIIRLKERCIDTKRMYSILQRRESLYKTDSLIKNGQQITFPAFRGYFGLAKDSVSRKNFDGRQKAMRIIELLNKGRSSKEVIGITGFSNTYTHQVIREYIGAGQVLSEKKDIVIDLLKNGVDRKKIVEQTGFSVSYVYGIARESGVKYKPRKAA